MVDRYSVALHFTTMKQRLPHWAPGATCIFFALLALNLNGQADNDAVQKYAEAGQRALAAGQYAEAQSDFDQLAKLEPNIAEVHATLGLINFKLRNYERAVREIHTAQKLKPGLPRLDS